VAKSRSRAAIPRYETELSTCAVSAGSIAET